VSNASRYAAKAPTGTVAAKMPLELVARVKAVASELSRRAADTPVSTSAALVLAVRRGLPLLEKHLNLNPARKT